MWEYNVQVLLRDTHLPRRPNQDPQRMIRLGYEGRELGAVCVIDQLDIEVFELTYGAIASRLRKGDPPFVYADEMVRDGLDCITAACINQGWREAKISGYIHPNNNASKHLCRRFNMHFTGQVENDLEVWERSLPVGDATPRRER